MPTVLIKPFASRLGEGQKEVVKSHMESKKCENGLTLNVVPKRTVLSL